jgi:hypothetical protein
MNVMVFGDPKPVFAAGFSFRVSVAGGKVY